MGLIYNYSSNPTNKTNNKTTKQKDVSSKSIGSNIKHER